VAGETSGPSLRRSPWGHRRSTLAAGNTHPTVFYAHVFQTVKLCVILKKYTKVILKNNINYFFKKSVNT
jgi:hypothetical protein